MKRLFCLLCTFVILLAGIQTAEVQSAQDKTPPKVVSCTPVNNAKNVIENTVITLRFNETIKKGSAFSSLALTGADAKKTAITSSVSGAMLTIKIRQALSFNTSYKLYIPKGVVKDATGNPTDKAYSLSFKTRNVPIGEIHAFYPETLSYSTGLNTYIDKLDSISFFWSQLKFDKGAMLVKNKFDLQPVRYAKQKGKSIQINVFSDKAVLESILPFKEHREKAADQLLELVTTQLEEDLSFDGIVIDFEGLQNNVLNGQSMKSHFVTFLKVLRAKLDKVQKKLYVAVNVSLFYKGYDYREILKVADRVILMAHDYQPMGTITKGDVLKYLNYSSKNNIRSIAPYKDVETAINEIKASATTPDQMKKVWLQFLFTGAQWWFSADKIEDWQKLKNDTKSSGDGKPAYQQIKDRVDNVKKDGTNLSTGYIKVLETPYITYFNTRTKQFHFILYEDKRSIEAKVNLAYKYGLGGISLWSLGNIPNYTDTNGKKYYMDVWSRILQMANKV